MVYNTANDAVRQSVETYMKNLYGIGSPALCRPTFTPAAGSYSNAQTVTISTRTSGATIRYTTDGSTPAPTAGTVYSSAVTISANTTLQAIAYEAAWTDSMITIGVYTIPSAPRRRSTRRRGPITPSTYSHHQHHHQWRNHPLYHQWHHAEFDRRHGVQQRGEHHRHLHAAGHRL